MSFIEHTKEIFAKEMYRQTPEGQCEDVLENIQAMIIFVTAQVG